jgi:hypothetical protein
MFFEFWDAYYFSGDILQERLIYAPLSLCSSLWRLPRRNRRSAQMSPEIDAIGRRRSRRPLTGDHPLLVVLNSFTVRQAVAVVSRVDC